MAEIDFARREAQVARYECPQASHGAMHVAATVGGGPLCGQMRFDDEALNADHRYAHGFIDDGYVERLKRAISGAATADDLQQTVGWTIRKFHANDYTDTEPAAPNGA